MPPMPTMAMQQPKHHVPIFTVPCPACDHAHKHLKPLGSTFMGAHAENGTNIMESVHIFKCPESGNTFTARSIKLVPAPLAVEEDNSPTPSVSTNSASLPTWTTNVNLRLSISITNYTTPLVIGLTLKDTNNVYIAGATNVVSGKGVIVKFPTEVGKVYKCQATDDAKQTWIDGPLVVGNGMKHIVYESAIKPSRIYRVMEIAQ